MALPFTSKLSGLWQHDNFLRLWAAQSLSAIGGRITRTALPMIAIITLASPEATIGLLSAAGLIPVALMGLFGGGFVERARKRDLMVSLDLMRAGLILLIPIAAWVGMLQLWLLFVIAAIAGAATALFQNADVAFLPRLVGREHLVEGNSKLQATESAAEFIGPGLAGLLIQFLTAPFAIVFNVATFLWSAFWLARIKNVVEERVGVPSDSRRLTVLMEDLKVGWRAIMSQPALRAAFLSSSIQQISWGFFFALYQLFVLRELHLSPAIVGIIISGGGVSGLIGAFVAGPLIKRAGFGAAVLIAFALAQVGNSLLLLAAVGGPLTIPLLFGHQLFGDGCLVAFMIMVTSLRQTTVAENEIARANGVFQAVSGVVLPMASIGAGFLAGRFGTQMGVMIGVAIGWLGLLPLISPRLLKLRTVEQAQPA